MKKILTLVLCVVLLVGGSLAAMAAGESVYATGDVNVRSGPGLAYSILGSIKKGSSLYYLGESSTDSRGVVWYKVSYKKSSGWVSSVYSSLGGGSSTPVQSTYVRATASVNLRSGAGTQYEDIGTLEKGEQVLYLGTSSKDSRGVTWYLVQYYSYGTGWVSSTYSELVTGTSAGVADTTTSVVGTYVKSTGGNSNIRSGAGLGYDDLGTMKKGETATYLGSYSTDERGVVWYSVRFDGITGWVSSRYATLY